jgi:ribonuclease P protein component
LTAFALLATVGSRRAQHLRNRSEFAAVYRHGKPFRNEFVVLRTLRTNGPMSRFGFTTGRALGGAVVRNRVKRRLREIVRSLPVAEGWDIILNARSGCVGADYDTMKARVGGLVRKAGILNE